MSVWSNGVGAADFVRDAVKVCVSVCAALAGVWASACAACVSRRGGDCWGGCGGRGIGVGGRKRSYPQWTVSAVSVFDGKAVCVRKEAGGQCTVLARESELWERLWKVRCWLWLALDGD